AERCPCLVSYFNEFQLTEHVRARLARIHDVAIDLTGLDPVVDGLLTRPMLRMQAGVDHQSPRTEEFRVELSEQTFRVTVIPLGLGGQLFRVKSPSFTEGRNAPERAYPSKPRQARILHLQGDLKVMAWHRLVIDQRAEPKLCNS